MVHTSMADKEGNPQFLRTFEEEMSTERIPVQLRLGPMAPPPTVAPTKQTSPKVNGKRKPGRPPGKRTVQSSPKLIRAWLSLTQQERPMGPAPEALVNLKVADLLLLEENEWNLEAIRQILPFEEEKIRLLKPSLSGAPDKLMWLKSPTGEFTTKTGSEWINFCSRQNLPPSGIVVGALAPWILWQIWKARNSLIFSDKGASVAEVISKAIVAAREWNESQSKAPAVRRPQPARLQALEDCVRVRSDAAWNESMKVAGLGWIVKSTNRSSSFSAPMQFVGSPLIAEGLAMREAVSKCKELGLTRLRCESDCEQLVKALTSDSPLAELYSIVSDIKNVALSFEVVSFSWISREKNNDADSLAKQALVAELAIMNSPNFV
ncbi:hypothetical protein IGI04_007958 [Brassica rapa subsp. trilocularis]|uniref:RNase H type-1 domain-containing protein n=1 Tax=Brassica rapa subsp. trilocularis TaxID=1813537 RepID=A0ABQ7NLE0_BRACM|nr:hypothetical protein IGI04_007958 [Brassica rapa subsp. trilocularis]